MKINDIVEIKEPCSHLAGLSYKKMKSYVVKEFSDSNILIEDVENPSVCKFVTMNDIVTVNGMKKERYLLS